MDLEQALHESIELAQRRLAGNAKAPRRKRGGQGLDARLGQGFLHRGALGLETIHPQIKPGAQIHALHQRPKFRPQLVFERLHQPLGQVVPVALHQISGLDLLALVKPALFLVAQGAAQKITRPIKAQNRQPALLGTAARGCKVVKQQLFTQHGVHRFGQRGPLARPQTAVLAKKTRHRGVGRVVKSKGQRDKV